MIAYFDPADFQRCLSLLTQKIEAMATRAGVPDSEFIDLESTLASLPSFSRDLARIMLDGVWMRAEENHPTMAFAARYVLNLAREVWEDAPLHLPSTARTRDHSTSAR